MKQGESRHISVSCINTKTIFLLFSKSSGRIKSWAVGSFEYFLMKTSLISSAMPIHLSWRCFTWSANVFFLELPVGELQLEATIAWNDSTSMPQEALTDQFWSYSCSCTTLVTVTLLCQLSWADSDFCVLYAQHSLLQVFLLLISRKFPYGTLLYISLVTVHILLWFIMYEAMTAINPKVSTFSASFLVSVTQKCKTKECYCLSDSSNL